MNMFQILDLFWKKRVMILTCYVGVTLLGIAIAFIIPIKYEATTTLLEIDTSTSTSTSQLDSLASLAGVSLPSSSGGGTDIVLALLKSRILKESVVSELDLIPLWFKGNTDVTELLDSAVKRLEAMISVDQDRVSSVITITVRSPDPKLSASIANAAVDSVRKLLKERDYTSSKKSIQTLEEQMGIQGQKVKSIQDDLIQFQIKTGIIDPKGQSSGSLQFYQSLLTQKFNLEVSLSTARNMFTASNSKVISLEDQLASLNEQIKKLQMNSEQAGLLSMKQAPALLIEYQNKLSDLDVASKLLLSYQVAFEKTLVSQQDSLYIEVIDTAIPQPKDGKPDIKFTILLVVLVGTFPAAFLPLFLYGIARFKEGWSSRERSS